MALYDTIGTTYTSTRVPDRRIAAQILGALGTARTVINVGAGGGNYEPTDRLVIGLDPSNTMLRSRLPTLGPAVQGVSAALPFADGSFDAAMGTFTLHHWPNLGAGLREVRRVAPKRQVFLTYEPSLASSMWILDYFPEILDLPHERNAPNVEDIAAHLGIREVQVVAVPHDCTDGFGGAYWARPESYLVPDVQAGMSMLALLEPGVRRAGTERLRSSLESGEWEEKFGSYRTQHSIDLGYRLIIAGE